MFVFKKLLRYLFFFKRYSIFPRGGLWSPTLTPPKTKRSWTNLTVPKDCTNST